MVAWPAPRCWSGGYDYVSSGGIAISTLVYDGGEQGVGGVASFTVLSSGGQEDVFAGGVTSDTVVSSGALQFVYSGGVADNTTVQNGGALVVLPDGLAPDAVNAGGQIISTGVVVLSNYSDDLVSAASGTLSGGVFRLRRECVGLAERRPLELARQRPGAG